MWKAIVCATLAESTVAVDLPDKPRNQEATGTLNPLALRAALILIGFTAIVAQIVLMRELMVVFYGNEISLGLMLANWLLWTAVGSSVLGRWAPKVSKQRRVMASLQVLIGVVFPCTIWLVRASKAVFQPIPGEILGPGPMFLTSLATLSLFCLTSGWLFAAGSRLYADEVGATTGRGTSAVYLLEAMGSGTGGIVASLLLIRYLDAFAIASLVGLLNLLAAINLLVLKPWLRRALAVALVGVFALLVFPILSPRFEAYSLARLWRGFHLVTTRNSIYGNLAITETEGSRSLYENGLVLFTAPDPAAAEEAVHYALLQHPRPRSLLLVGGGINGGLAQALQHPSLRRLDYVELDPAIIKLARRYFAEGWNSAQADPRVRVHSIDGRLFLKTVGEKFDVIIVNLPDPQTAQLNRFYTEEFLREVAGRLNPGGVFSFELRGAENYISPELAAFLRCINKTLGGVFPQVTAMPGETVHFFAAVEPGILAADPRELGSRLRSRGIRTSYVREYYIPFRMSKDRRLDLDEQIRPRADTPVNRDFAPIAYYFNVALWSSRFDQHYRRLFEVIAHERFPWVVTLAGLVSFGLAAALWHRSYGRKLTGGCAAATRGRAQPFGQLVSKKWEEEGRRGPCDSRKGAFPQAGAAEPPEPPQMHARDARAAAGFCVTAMGFTLIGLEILLLLAFQAIYGYVYQQLAIVIAAFMVGMALGSWWGLRGQGASDNGPDKQPLTTLVSLQIVAVLAPLAVYALLLVLTPVRSPLGLWVVSQVAFPALAVFCGLLGGYQFPVASRIFFEGANDGTSSPGTLYALDLVGACLAAVMLSAYLVPVFGFMKTALFMGVVNLAPAALAGLSGFESRARRN